MLRLLTAWEENMPMMEKAMEKFLFSVPELSADKAGDTHTHTYLWDSRVPLAVGPGQLFY